MKALRVATAARAGTDGAGATAAVLRWQGAGEPRVVVRRLPRHDKVPPAYRALLLGLWEARRAGASALVISTDDAEVMAQVEGTQPPPPEAVGSYLQVRALLNAFRSAAVRYVAPVRNQEAAFAAAAAGHARRPVYADLPLWAAAS